MTFLHSSAREAKLEALLADNSEVQERVGELAKTYEAFLAEDVQGMRLAHLASTTRLMQQPDIAFDEKGLRDLNLSDDMLLLLAQFLNQKHKTTKYHIGGSLSKISPNAKLLDKISLQGVQYSTVGRRTRNSHVLFRLPQTDTSGSSTRLKPGQITDIFIHSSACVWEDEVQCCQPSLYLCI